MKLYRTGYGNELIKEVEVEKYTEKSVWIKRSFNNQVSRSAKHSNYDNFWDTLEDAKNHLKAKFDRQINSAKNTIDLAESELRELDKY